ncbi:hypothetical protein GCM10010331_69800 [Streptomyces xanthochromogenes]|nr:hypothetical protein GCM10010331_69800 [Streptomyces xanthochromogenes]
MSPPHSTPPTPADPAPRTETAAHDGHRNAVAEYLDTVIRPLRDLDLGDTWPDATPGTDQEAAHGSL